MSVGRQNKDNNKNWCTPPKYVDTIYKMFDKIELDPCSNMYSIVNAETEYVLPTDGLKKEWDFKTIFVNPPYGRDSDRKTSIKNWIIKMNDTYIKYDNEILALIPVSTNASHYKEIIFENATSICFLEDTRLKFMINGEIFKKGAPMACAMVYWGKDKDKFEEIYKEFGKVFHIN